MTASLPAAATDSSPFIKSDVRTNDSAEKVKCGRCEAINILGSLPIRMNPWSEAEIVARSESMELLRIWS